MQPTARPRASIVILAYGNRAATEKCLASLEQALGDELDRSFELVLVDNNSPDDTLDMAVERHAESGTPHPSSDLPRCR
jgi:glycosyltransferase involved in cell wall biosynthesis